MKHARTLAIVILVPFSLLSLYAVREVGYVGILDYQRQSPAGWQVSGDLVVALVLILLWLIPHARQQGRNPWPWVVITLLAGSFGPLLYLATGRQAEPSCAGAASA
jgi:hypothetical protein